MKEKFTKGEWYVDFEIGCICSKEDNLDDGIICDMMPSECDDTEEGNAHLIAVAPEMYEMLKVVLRRGYLTNDLTREKINKLLAKARGESNE